ncbi:MAG: C4-dicarboxylate ABC transporter permease, partial [Betaproteobacteria bacterium]
ALGVPDFAAHMFIFYYAVLSAVSSPNALAPFAAASITGGDPHKTILHSWKYTLPALVVPFVFVLDPAGIALLLKAPAAASWLQVAWIAFAAVAGIAALAAGVQKWMLRACSQWERWVLIACGLMLVYPSNGFNSIGLFGLAVMLGWQWRGLRMATPVIR